MGFTVAKGRNRSKAKRTQSGRVSRAGKNEENALTHATIKRLLALGRSPELSCPVGMWLVNKEIDQLSYDAAVRYREQCAKYHRAIDARQIKTAVLEPAGGSPPDVDSDDGQRITAQEVKDIAKFESARAALQMVGEDVRRAVHDLVVEEQQIEWARRDIAKIGLRTLVLEYGLLRMK